MSNKIAIIGGTGLTALDDLEITHKQIVMTPYGEASAPLLQGTYAGHPVVFLARHGSRHTIPPHKINYRANIWALHELNVTKIISVAAVGGIHADMCPSELVIPHQLIDYTYGREHTFFSEDLTHVTHVDFSQPYCAELRQQLLSAGKEIQATVHSNGVYGVTQGPRLETIAEIDRMERDGCDIVGMTGMPEAGLARELDMCYAACAVVANEAAGRGAEEITMADIEQNLTQGIQHVRQLLSVVLSNL